MDIPRAPAHLPTRGNAFSRWLGRSFFRLMGWKITGELPNTGKCLMIAAPHTSNWDFILGMFGMLMVGLKANWMGKDSIFVGPFRPLLIWLGGIPTVRSQHTGAVEQRINIFNQHEKLIVALAPEGTRSATDTWKTGFYHIAVGAKVPIFPMAWDYQKKEIILFPLFNPTGNTEADLAALKAIFKDVTPKYPQNSLWQQQD